VSAQKGQQNFQGEIFYNVQFARTRPCRREEFCPSGQ
jgi:hypothetical protein